MNRFARIFYFVLVFPLNLAAQCLPEDYTANPEMVQSLNDGFQNINPFFSEDGKHLWFTKIGHPLTVGSEVQDIWHSTFVNGRWTPAVNDIPGLNTPLNDLIIGTSGNDLLYILRFAHGGDEQLTKIHAYRFEQGHFTLDHTIKIPELNFLSEFFGFFMAPDESFIIISMKGSESFGKEDLYLMRRTGDAWTTPIHMGARINSSGFEMSPYLAPDGKHLFFASEGHGGMGSADIFVATRLDNTWQNWSKPANLGPKVNSAHFEAYLSLNPVLKEAMFVSNREEVTGGLFLVSYTESQPQEELTAHPSASGFLRMEKLPPMNVKLNLLDENDQIVQSVTTNENGYFNLQSFLPDRDYKIAIDDSIRAALEGAEIYLTNDLGDKMVFMSEPDLGIFGFKVLSGQRLKEVAALEELAREGKVVDTPTTISGKVSAPSSSGEPVTLQITDEANKVIETITTDENGYFSFSTNASEKSYFLSVEPGAQGLVDVYEVFLTNDNPDEDIIVTKTDKHLFEFRTLADASNEGLALLAAKDEPMPPVIRERYTGQPSTDALSGYIRLGKLPVMNTRIVLMDEDDNVLDEAVTNAEGVFVIDQPIAEGSYSLQLDEAQEQQLKGSEIYIARNPADVLLYLNDDRAGVFAFRKLAKQQPMTLYSLRTETERGAVVNSTAALRGKLTFDYAALPQSEVEIKLMDESDNIIQVTQVDDDGNFAFTNYTVNKNYFIAVEDGLSDIYQIYLSGENKNVLVNSTNKYVFAFKVLPGQEILLSEIVEMNPVADGLSGISSGADFLEFNYASLRNSGFLALQDAANRALSGQDITVRISKELASSQGVELETFCPEDIQQILAALERLGLTDNDFTWHLNGRDQVILAF